METKTTREIVEDTDWTCHLNDKWVRVDDVVSMLEFFDSCNEELLLDTAIKTKLLELKR